LNKSESKQDIDDDDDENKTNHDQVTDVIEKFH